MYVFDPRTLQLGGFFMDGKYPFRNGHIFCIRPDANDCLWVGTSDGVFCFKDGKEIRHFTSADTKLPEGNVYEIFFDSSGMGWICTETGLCVWDPSAERLRTDVFPGRFAHKEKIRMIFETSEHRLLFLPEKGDIFVSDLSLKEYGYVKRPALLSDKDVMSVIEGDDGAYWFTTNNGIYRFDGKEGIVPFGMADGLPSSVFINCFAIKDDSGTLWFGNSRGLVYLPGGDAYRLPRPAYPVAVSSVFVDGVDESDSMVRDSTRYRLSLSPSSRSLTLLLSDLLFTFPGIACEYRLDGDKEWIPVVGKSEISFYRLPGKNFRCHIRYRFSGVGGSG